MAGILGYNQCDNHRSRPSIAKVMIVNTKMNGFSLIEILVSLCILGIVLLPFLNFISYRLSKEHESDEMIKATEIARIKMEQALLQPEIWDCEEIIQEKYLVKIKVLDGDNYDEPDDLHPLEIRITVFQIKDNKKLVELCALK